MTLADAATGGTVSHATQQREKLARMAGQIGGFFEAYPREQAVPPIAVHINKLWGLDASISGITSAASAACSVMSLGSSLTVYTDAL